jgi:hypothetical protein
MGKTSFVLEKFLSLPSFTPDSMICNSSAHSSQLFRQFEFLVAPFEWFTRENAGRKNMIRSKNE